MVTSEVPAAELGGGRFRYPQEDVDHPGPRFQYFQFFKSGDGPAPQSFLVTGSTFRRDCPVADIARLTAKKIVILKWHFRSAVIAHDGFFEFER
ncbi:MAG TPA: hypothetical protein VE111_05685 [Bradyrhizobium sp.]|nr:hypothetical protein [Bradyrhizobium sp.]